MKWSGLFTALITPFLEGRLDEEGLCFNIAMQEQAGVDGLVILGTTGEAPTLSPTEKERILTLSRQKWKGPLIVGTGTNCTQTTIEATAQAAILGADAALLISPYYNKPTQEGLYQHFKKVAAHAPIPLILYNHPGRTGVNLEPATLTRLAKLPNIVGIKESSDTLNHEAFQLPDFAILSGNDIATFPLMVLGAHGVVSVVSNLIPQEMKELVTACMQGDFAKAREVHMRLLPLFKASALESNPTPIKAAMHRLGLPAGLPRLPLSPLLPQNQQQLEEVLAAWSVTSP